MATAKEKRENAAQFAINVVGKWYEQGNTNAGPNLDPYLHFTGSVWSPKQYWCAGFISAVAYNVDKNLGGIKNRYNTASSQYEGAGYYSRDIKDARIGLAVVWKNKPEKCKNNVCEKCDDGGHVGIVVAITSSGITTVEGNTACGDSGSRNGGEVCKHTRTWDKLKNPSSCGFFVGYVKIWDETDESLGQPSKNITNPNVDTKDDGRPDAVALDNTTTPEPQITDQQLLDYLAKFSDIMTNKQAADSETQPKEVNVKSKKDTTYEAKQISVSDMPKDNVQVIVPKHEEKYN